jgi:hypothetical protein
MQPYENTRELPYDVVREMRKFLHQVREEAGRHQAPGDGYMIGIGEDVQIRGGKWENDGWSLQATIVQDERIAEGSWVVVHGYSGSVCTKGSVSMRMEWTADEQRVLDEQQLAKLLEYRAELEQEIADLRAKLGS